MMDEILLKNYHNALEQKYNAICFDIDGTLTEKNSTKLDKRILPFIANLLNRHIPVVFITGRGETGLLDLKNQIIDGLKNNYEISNYDFSKLYALTNDGARLFLTTDDSNDIFNVSKYIASSIDLQKLKYLDKELWVKLEEKDLLKYCKVTYSKDEKIDVIVNIRVATTTNDENINNRVLEIINDLVTNSESENINLTIGVYNGNKIFQIGTTIKSNAIQVAEKIIGIPQNSMMRIGDCGDELGNDYSMLNCSQGFSVDKTSCETDKCFPILDDNNRILKGVDATLFLLSKAKLLPTICLEHATETNYTKAYAKVERQMNYGKNKRIMVFNEIINSKFQLVDGIYGLYDKSSGSIKIPMYDWIGIDDDNPLKQFWSKQFILKMKYAMCDNENILLRGSQVYYYFLSNRYHDEITRNDITSKDMYYWDIAKTIYGDATYWPLLYAYNNDKFKISNVIKKGSTISYRNIPDFYSVREIKYLNNTLSKSYIYVYPILTNDNKYNHALWALKLSAYYDLNVFKNNSNVIPEETYMEILNNNSTINTTYNDLIKYGQLNENIVLSIFDIIKEALGIKK